jgi:TonB family protein
MLMAAGLATAQEASPAPAEQQDSPGVTVSQNATTPADGAADDADAGLLEPEPDATAEAPAPTRLETQIEFERLMAQAFYAEASVLGQQLLELTIAEFGELSDETARAHNALADAQRAAQDYEGAELNYLRSVEIYRAIEGPFTAAAIEPTLGLGDSYFDDGQFTNALSAYSDARSVQRRAYGLLDEGQIEIIDRMTRSYQAMDLHAEANEQQLAALNLIERNHPSGSLEMLEGLYRYARWLRSVGRYLDERAQYERAIRVIRAEHDKDSLLLVTPYREIANSFREQAFEDPRGAGALNAALDILEMQPEPDALELARVLVDIGDWKTAFSPAGSGDSEYIRAWDLLGGLERGDALRSEWFQSTRPISVLFVRMSTRDLAPDPSDRAAVRGKVLVQFDVTPGGRTENVFVVESEPVGFKDEAAVRSISQSRFRPRIADGMLVEARGLGLLFNFSYLPEDDA